MTDVSNTELTISLRDLSRSIGSRRSEQISWTVPHGFGTSTMRIPEGTQVLIDVDMTAIDQGVLVGATFDIEFVGECVRCLEEVHRAHHVGASDVYREPRRSNTRAQRVKQDDRDMQDFEDQDDTREIGLHDTIDLLPFLRDSIIPLIDVLPLCSPDCLGLCAVCGERLADLPPDHHHDVIDPRFAKLSHLLQDSEVFADTNEALGHDDPEDDHGDDREGKDK